MVRVKICGITKTDDALRAAQYGAWAVGFNFHKKSPRYISPSKAKKIVDALPPLVTPVGIFVNLSERAIRDICSFTHIQTVQLHGDEDARVCSRLKALYKVIKAVRVTPDFDFKKLSQFSVDAFLFDACVPPVAGAAEAYGGTGTTFDWKILAAQKIEKPFILSGGLNAENVREALSVVTPFAIDVATGVEKSPGIKDPQKLHAFLDMLSGGK